MALQTATVASIAAPEAYSLASAVSQLPSTDPMLASLLTKASSLHVQILVQNKPKQQYHELVISVADLVARELDMHRVAAAYQVSGQRWNGSRLYNDYMEHCLQYQQDDETAASVVTLTLDPIAFCLEHHLTRDMVWTQALTDLLEEFYQTSLLQVGEIGLPFLLALEYFGILYQPDQLVFSSLQAYKLVKEWSDYLAQRSFMAEWVAEQILVAQGDDMDYFFATCPRVNNTHGQELAVIQHQELNTNDPHIVWVFFNAPGTGVEMQRDFCHFLENLLTMVQAEFIDTPAVLHVRVVGANAAALRETGSPQAVQEDADEDREEKKTDTDHDTGYPSPRHVSEFDAARMDIYETRKATPPLMPSSDQRMERIAPKTPFGTADDDLQQKDYMVISDKQKKKGFVNRPWRKDAGRPPISARPRHSKRSTVPAPVSVIRARSADMTVQSALTGPFFLDGSELRDVYENNNQVKAEALRQEWIQSSVLNRGLSMRIRALLDDTSDNEDIPPIRSRLDRLAGNDVAGGDAGDMIEARSSPDHVNEQRWDWLSTICDYPANFLKTREPLTSKVALDKIFESVENVFDPGSAVACSGSADAQEPMASNSPPRKLVSKAIQRPKPESVAASPKRRGTPTRVNTTTRGQRLNLDDCEACSYDGELNFDPRSREVLSKPNKGKDASAVKHNHSLATATTTTSSRSASQRAYRPNAPAVTKSKTSNKPFAALKGLFRRKKQYRV